MPTIFPCLHDRITFIAILCWDAAVAESSAAAVLFSESSVLFVTEEYHIFVFRKKS